MAEEATEEVTESQNESTESWTDSIPEEHRETFSNFKSRDELFKTINYTPPKEEGKDWRDDMDEDLKKTAERFSSPKEMVRSIQDLRKRESLTRVPGKDATEEELSKYYKAIGVPDSPEGYKLIMPEGQELTPEIEAANKRWSERFHGLRIPAETVNKLNGFVQEEAAAIEAAEAKADAEFVEKSVTALKSEWKGDEYDKNVTIANKAFREAADRSGLDLEDLKTMQTKEGRFLMDDPRMLKMFSVFGREMSEGSLGPTLSSDQRETMQEQLTEIREKIQTAQQAGKSKEADSWYAKEQALIAKMEGNKPIR